jgi:glycine/D-amino acid oxidase-like deaminating enzyme
LTEKESSGGPNTWSVRKRAPKVAVIGAGIVGSSVAYHLARRGAVVTLIDKGQPAGECTGKSFAWIGESSPLGSQALGDYHRLEHELYPALRINWSGSLAWKAGSAETERSAREQAAEGYDVRLLERDEIARLEPNLRKPPDLAALAPSHGAIDPVETTQLLVRAAQESGARVHLDAEEAKLVVSGNRVTGVRIAEQAFEADIVVVAAGVGSNLVTETSRNNPACRVVSLHACETQDARRPNQQGSGVSGEGSPSSLGGHHGHS